MHDTCKLHTVKQSLSSDEFLKHCWRHCPNVGKGIIFFFFDTFPVFNMKHRFYPESYHNAAPALWILENCIQRNWLARYQFSIKFIVLYVYKGNAAVLFLFSSSFLTSVKLQNFYLFMLLLLAAEFKYVSSFTFFLFFIYIMIYLRCIYGDGSIADIQLFVERC